MPVCVLHNTEKQLLDSVLSSISRHINLRFSTVPIAYDCRDYAAVENPKKRTPQGSTFNFKVAPTKISLLFTRLQFKQDMQFSRPYNNECMLQLAKAPSLHEQLLNLSAIL